MRFPHFLGWPTISEQRGPPRHQETTASVPGGRSMLPDSCTILPTAAVVVRRVLDLGRGRTGPVEGVAHPQCGRGSDANGDAGSLDPVLAADHRTDGGENRA